MRESLSIAMDPVIDLGPGHVQQYPQQPAYHRSCKVEKRKTKETSQHPAEYTGQVNVRRQITHAA